MEEVENSSIKNGEQSSKRSKMANNTQINSNNNQIDLNVEETMEDRLSSLPDEILLRILSHLETLYAAKTAFISRRWRNLWKGLTTYEFHTSGTNFDKIAKLLSLLTSPKIRVFEYSFCSNLKNFKWKSAENFYHLLRSRNVEVLKLRSMSSISRGSAYLPVSKCVLNYESLVVLELDGHLDWKLKLDVVYDLPVNGTSINLPNLKRLLMRVDAFQYCLLRTLLQFCPVLEDLCLLLELCNKELQLDIVAPNLTSLKIEVEVPASSSLIAIDAPKLAKLKIRDPCSYYVFIRIPTSLIEANMKLKRIERNNWFPVDDEENHWTGLHDWTLALSLFVRGMSSVTSLKVQCYANMHTFFGPQCYSDMAVFPDLTFFKTTINTLCGWEDLLRSLHCFPNLEHLELKMDDFDILWPDIWVSPIVLPDCLLTKLKRITVKKAKQSIHELTLLEFILNHANVLEELCISSPSGSDTPMEYKLTQSNILWTEYNFCQALFNLPRSSLTCQIVFAGVYINTSSNTKLFGCQIRRGEQLADSDGYYWTNY